MRRMFSKNQIEKLAKEVADAEIGGAEISVSQLKAHEDYQGQYLQVQNDGSIIPAGTMPTKWYKHTIVDEASSYTFELVNDDPTPIDFVNTITSYTLMKNYCDAHKMLYFRAIAGYGGGIYSNIMYIAVDNYFFIVSYDGEGAISGSVIDDWSLSDTTDTVSPF